MNLILESKASNISTMIYLFKVRLGKVLFSIFYVSWRRGEELVYVIRLHFGGVTRGREGARASAAHFC